MADTTKTSSLVTSVTARNIATGVYALWASYTDTATPSASHVYLMLPLHSGVTVLGGWVKAVFDGGSMSMDLMVGVIDNKSLFLAATEVLTGKAVTLDQNLPHVVTLTDSDTFPLMKPMTVTIAVAASGTIATTPVYTLLALMQND